MEPHRSRAVRSFVARDPKKQPKYVFSSAPVVTAGLIQPWTGPGGRSISTSHHSPGYLIPGHFGGAMTTSRIQLTISLLAWLGVFARIAAIITDVFRWGSPVLGCVRLLLRASRSGTRQSFTSARAAGSWGGLFLCREFCREVQSKKANLRFGYTIRLE